MLIAARKHKAHRLPTSAWHGFTKAADRRRINLLLERAKRYGYCSVGYARLANF